MNCVIWSVWFSPSVAPTRQPDAASVISSSSNDNTVYNSTTNSKHEHNTSARTRRVQLLFLFLLADVQLRHRLIPLLHTATAQLLLLSLAAATAAPPSRRNQPAAVAPSHSCHSTRSSAPHFRTPRCPVSSPDPAAGTAASSVPPATDLVQYLVVRGDDSSMVCCGALGQTHLCPPSRSSESLD